MKSRNREAGGESGLTAAICTESECVFRQDVQERNAEKHLQTKGGFDIIGKNRSVGVVLPESVSGRRE